MPKYFIVVEIILCFTQKFVTFLWFRYSDFMDKNSRTSKEPVKNIIYFLFHVTSSYI
jgi:hypothetical protein